jgi:hypothetical protein
MGAGIHQMLPQSTLLNRLDRLAVSKRYFAEMS